MHATIIAHSAKSPTLHNVIALYPISHSTPWHASFGQIGTLNRTEAMPRAAMQRGGVLEAECQVLPFRYAQQFTTNAAPSATALSL